MSLRPSIALPLLLTACTARPLDAGDSDTDATSTGDTTSPGSTTALPGTGAPTTSGADTGAPVTSTSTASTATTGDASDTIEDPSGTAAATTHSFITPPDVGQGVPMCDHWIQDCPEGEKCMPYSSDGDNHWDSLKCVDIVPNPAGMYEPCMSGPISTGEDTCDKGLMCWYGQCIGLCIGSPDAPDCVDPLAWCAISGSGVLALCLPQCEPLLQNCSEGDLCIADPGNPEAWICVLDASGEEGQAFDVCEYANACDPGLFCTEPSAAVECDAKQLGCCTPLCDLTQPNTCPGAGQECLPWYEPGMAPPPHEHVGFCSLPMP